MNKMVCKIIYLSIPNLAPLRPFDLAQDMLGASNFPFLRGGAAG
jgi:hypothetical protein